MLKKNYIKSSRQIQLEPNKEETVENSIEKYTEESKIRLVDSFEDEVEDEKDSNKELLTVPKTPGADSICKRLLEESKSPVAKATTAPSRASTGSLASEKAGGQSTRVPRTSEPNANPFLRGCERRALLTEANAKKLFID